MSILCVLIIFLINYIFQAYVQINPFLTNLHERFDINNDELLGTIWEHKRAKKGKKRGGYGKGGGFCLIWKRIIVMWIKFHYKL